MSVCRPYEGVVIAWPQPRPRTWLSSYARFLPVKVERTFQTYSPLVASIEVKRRGDVRRAKLYYLRSRSGKVPRGSEKLDYKSFAAKAAAAKALNLIFSGKTETPSGCRFSPFAIAGWQVLCDYLTRLSCSISA